jgi:hypothetical protein
MRMAFMVFVGMAVIVIVAMSVVVLVLMCISVSVMVLVRMLMCLGGLLRRVGVLSADENAGLTGCNAAAIDGFKGERRAQPQGRGGLFEQRGGDTRIDQGAEQHVSADAGKTFEIANTHGCSL